MCGFVVCRTGELFDNGKVRRRGPDGEFCLERDGFSFHHYLLHITGLRLEQPLVDGGVVCVFNGEIYNRPYSVSDGEVLIPLYRKYGKDFVRYLDGEFSIALYDFDRREAVFATDAFGTKPMWTRGARAASYGSCIQGQQMPPNTVKVVSFDGRETSEMIHNFDFEHQDKSTLVDWTDAFNRAVKLRATQDCFLGLSAGYDSGAIAASLLSQCLPFKAYCLLGGEDRGLLF
jgi:asparagine synthetase B (glutamine-hydrolysing)